MTIMWPFEKCRCREDIDCVMEKLREMESALDGERTEEPAVDPFTWTPRAWQWFWGIGLNGISRDFWDDGHSGTRDTMMGIYPTKKMAENALGIAREAIRKHYSNQPKP